MVAYSFQKEFVSPSLAGTKIGTIRGLRMRPSRHARPGEQLQHYTGMRTKYCAPFGRSTCQSTRLILLAIREGSVHYPASTETISDEAKLNIFAIGDGFANWDKLCEFWHRMHPDAAMFQGAHIIWGDSFVPVAVA